MFEKIKNNKALKIIWNIVYALLFIFVLLILLVVIMQRVSNNNLSLGGFRIFNIVSESMIPKYQIGDVLVAKELEASELKVGDDVVYKGEKDSFAGKIVTHQVIQIEEENGEYKFHTKGIANDEEDPLVSQNQITGKVIYKIQTLSLISKIVSNLVSFYFTIFIPIAIILFIEIRKIFLNLRGNDEEDDDEEEEKVEKKDKN